MTALAEDHRTAWPDGILFWPPLQIKYQTDYIARMYLMLHAMLAADLGTGKSVMGLGVAGLAFEQGVIDHVLVVCEPNKLDKTEWPARLRAVHEDRVRRLPRAEARTAAGGPAAGADHHLRDGPR